MRDYEYTVILHPGEDAEGYWAEVPTLPGCFAQGDDPEDTIALIKEAIQAHIQAMVKDGEPIPVENDHPVAVRVKVAA